MENFFGKLLQWQRAPALKDYGERIRVDVRDRRARFRTQHISMFSLNVRGGLGGQGWMSG